MRTQFSKFAFMAGLSLALAFTFGCSNGEETSSGNEQKPLYSYCVSTSVGMCFSGPFSECESGGFLSNDCPFNSGTPSSSSGSVVYGTPVNYQGETYKTVVIGNQTWFQRNLNYAVEDSRCFNNNEGNCDIYGRLYSWVKAMALPDSCSASTRFCTSQVYANHKGICPSGWHIPSDADWNALLTAVGGPSTAGKYLKTVSGWANGGNGEDKYGFSALPGGMGSPANDYSSNHNVNFSKVGNYGYWLASNVSNEKMPTYTIESAHIWYMRYDFERFYDGSMEKFQYGSVRCLKD